MYNEELVSSVKREIERRALALGLKFHAEDIAVLQEGSLMLVFLKRVYEEDLAIWLDNDGPGALEVPGPALLHYIEIVWSDRKSNSYKVASVEQGVKGGFVTLEFQPARLCVLFPDLFAVIKNGSCNYLAEPSASAFRYTPEYVIIGTP